MTTNLESSIVRILRSDGSTVGTGFVAGERLILTCAHVVQAVGSGPGGRVNLRFHVGGEQREALVSVEEWRPPEDDDIAVLRLDGDLSAGVTSVVLGNAKGSDGHSFRAFGYPPVGEVEGIWATGKIEGLVREAGRQLIQLSSQNLAQGISGGPVLDESRRQVVGMVTSVFHPDSTTKHRDMGFATPTETLRQACPELQISDICPYRGLDAFTEADAEFFFGRERVVNRLMDRLRREPRFLAALGPSGSGKSSVIQAGLIPQLRQGKVPGSDHWGILLTRPVGHPFEQVAAEGLIGDDLRKAVQSWLRQHPNQTRLVLVIDQFEELLVATPESARWAFAKGLSDLLESPLPITVVIVMRDDFYSRFSQEVPALLSWLEVGLVNVPNVPVDLTLEELTTIVRTPAETVGLEFESSLVDTVVGDALEMTIATEEESKAGRSTILPLLEFALTQLWEQRQDGILTHQGYHDIGGVTGGLTQWADRAFYSLPPEQQPLARRILTDLVHLGDESQGLPYSRRQRSKDSLVRSEDERDQVYYIIQQLADARLVVTARDPQTGQDIMELVHEALLWKWKRLQDWLREDRPFLDWRQEIERRAKAWIDTSPEIVRRRDKDKLLRGNDLAVAENWLKERFLYLGQPEREYIRASSALAKRRKRFVASVVAIVFLAIGMFALFALYQRTVAEEQRNKAERLADEQQSLALAGGVGRALDDRDTDLALALALWATAIEAPPPAAQSALIEAAYASVTRRRMDPGTGWVLSVDISPDGFFAVAGTLSGTVSLWDLQRGVEVREFMPDAPPTPVWGIAFSPDGHTILAGYDNGEVILWNAETGVAVLTMKAHSQAVRGLAFTPDGSSAMTGSLDGKVILWNVTNGKVITELMGHDGAVLSVDISPDGRKIVSGSEDNTLIIWDVTTGKIMRQLNEYDGFVLSTVFSPDSNLILSGSADWSVRLWNVQTGSGVTLTTEHTDWVHSVAFGPDGKTALSASADHSLILWDLQTGFPIQRLDGHIDEVQSVAISRDGRLAVSGSRDGSLRVWDMTLFTEVGASLENIDAEVTSVAVSPDGSQLLTGLSNGRAVVWSVEDREVVRELLGHDAAVTSVALSPDGLRALTGSHDMTLALWDSTTGKRIRSLTGHTGAVRSVAFSPDGRTALSGATDAKVIVWNLEDYSFRSFEEHTNIVTAVTFSADGQFVISGSHDHSLIMQDLANGETIPQSKGHDSWVLDVDASRNGQLIASGSNDTTIILWDAETGKVVRRLRGHDGPVLSVSFGPNGETLLSSSSDGTLILWSVATGRLLRRFYSPSDVSCDLGERCRWVWDATYDPDGSRVFSVSADGHWRMWQVLPEDVDKLRSWLKQNRNPRELSLEERQRYGISDE